MSYVYCFFGVTATSIPAVMATALLQLYVANVAASGAVTFTSGRAYVCTQAPMSAAELTAWQTVLGSASYQLLGNQNGYFQHMNVEFVAL